MAILHQQMQMMNEVRKQNPILSPVTRSNPDGSCLRKTTRFPMNRPASMIRTVPGVMLALKHIKIRQPHSKSKNESNQSIKREREKALTWAWWACACVDWGWASWCHQQDRIWGVFPGVLGERVWSRGEGRLRRSWPWSPRGLSCGTFSNASTCPRHESDLGFCC